MHSDENNYSVFSVPIFNNSPKYRKFYNFLIRDVIGVKKFLTCDNTCPNALNISEESFNINPHECIGTGLCLINSTEKILKYNENFEIVPFSNKINDIALMGKVDTFFKGIPVSLPSKILDGKISNLEAYTATNETDHMSVWASSVLNYLSTDSNKYYGLEIEIIREENPRDGRIDICVRNGSEVLIVESKVSIKKAVIESRFNLQINAYLKETQKIVDEYNVNFKDAVKRNAVLLIGDKEADLYPSSSEYSTGNIGGYTDRFYKTVLQDNIKFVSVSALWCLMVYSVVKDKRIDWSVLFNKYLFGSANTNHVGLLSAGVIEVTKEGIGIIPIELG